MGVATQLDPHIAYGGLDCSGCEKLLNVDAAMITVGKDVDGIASAQPNPGAIRRANGFV
jgi:hypothetical protein